MPRRCPLLGRDDAQGVKATRAFGYQAEQDIWDIGNPTTQDIQGTTQISQFRRDLGSTKYPFVPDHSNAIGIVRLAWLSEVQNLDYTILIPNLIEGLTDSEERYAMFALTAITDILKHGPVDKLVDALPTLTIGLKKALDRDCVLIHRRVLEVLKRMCIIQPDVGPDLAFYVREILLPFNQYFERTRNKRDQIVYNDVLYSDIYDKIDEAIKLILRTAGPEYDTAERNIKRAIPTYQLCREI